MTSRKVFIAACEGMARSVQGARPEFGVTGPRESMGEAAMMEVGS